MELYGKLCELATNHHNKITVDLIHKTLTVGKKKIIDCGIIKDDRYDSLIDTAMDINELYRQYKYSVPEESDRGLHYFRALRADEMSDRDLFIGIPRHEARIKLEAYILLASMSGLLKWEHSHQWFVKGNDPDFVILKQYI